MIEIEAHGELVVAHLSGEIDLSNTASIENTIGRSVTSETPGFAIEMSNVTYLDSAGVRLLYRLEERAHSRRQRFVVVVPSGALITRTLEAAGVLGSLRIVGTRDEALDLLAWRGRDQT